MRLGFAHLALALLLLPSAGWGQRSALPRRSSRARQALPAEHPAVARSKPRSRSGSAPAYWQVLDKDLRRSARILAKRFGLAAVVGIAVLPLVLLLTLAVAVRRRRKRSKRKVGAVSQDPVSRRHATTAVVPKVTNEAPVVVAPLQPGRVQSLLLRGHAANASIAETLLALGFCRRVVQAFGSCCQSPQWRSTWAGAVAHSDVSLLDRLRQDWFRSVLLSRAVDWLKAQTLVRDSRLVLNTPSEAVAAGLTDLTLMHSDGLAADLSQPQRELLQGVRRCLDQAFGEASNPFAVGRLSPGVGDFLRSEAADPDYLLAALLGGDAVIERLTASGHLTADRFWQAVGQRDRHALSPRAGPAAHLWLHCGARDDDIMVPMLAAASGSISQVSQAVLNFSKQAQRVDGSLRSAMVRLGERALVLSSPDAGDSAAVSKNLRRLLGSQQIVKAERALAGNQPKRARRPTLVKAPAAGSLCSPEEEILGLFGSLLHHAERQLAAAHKTLVSTFQALAFPGNDPYTREIACCRLGYALGALGPEIVKDTSKPLQSAAVGVFALIRESVDEQEHPQRLASG